MEIKKQLWDNINSRNEKSSLFVFTENKFFNFKDLASYEMTVQYYIEYLENLEIKTVLYSTYFNDNFDDEDSYNEFVKGSDVSVVNLVKYENLTTEILIVDADGNEKILINNFFDAEMTINYINKEIKNQIELAKEELEELERFNNFIEEDKSTTIKELALEVYKNNISLGHFWEANSEQGVDNELKELNEEFYKVQKIFEQKELFDLSLKQTPSKKKINKI